MDIFGKVEIVKVFRVEKNVFLADKRMDKKNKTILFAYQKI